MENKPADKTPDDAVQPVRRPWTAPELTEYGSVAKLTQSGGSTAMEQGVPRQKMKK
jgi:hypothetical protein